MTASEAVDIRKCDQTKTDAGWCKTQLIRSFRRSSVYAFGYGPCPRFSESSQIHHLPPFKSSQFDIGKRASVASAEIDFVSAEGSIGSMDTFGEAGSTIPDRSHL